MSVRGLLRLSKSVKMVKTAYLTCSIRSMSHAESVMRSQIREELKDIRNTGTYKQESVITSKQHNEIYVSGFDKPLLNFCSNNYLGLSSHPEVIQAGIEALKSRANGMSSVRFICGTNDMHVELEEKISRFHERDDTILYASCFDANAGLFEVLLGENDDVYSDELNHASIIDGIRLCKANKYRYKHNDMEDLERLLKKGSDASTSNRKLIVTDGVFSMDGTISKLRDICDLADKYGCMTMIDECHATGFLGKTGRGTEEYLDVMGRVTIINTTLGKAMGGAAGGYTTGPSELIALLRQKSRPYLFSNALPPPVVGSAIKVFDILMDHCDLPVKIQENTRNFRTSMTAAGFQLNGDITHPIAPVMLGDERLAHEFASLMLDNGVYVVGFSHPVVPMNKARIRVQLSACHTEDNIKQAVDVFTQVGRQLQVI